MCSRPTNGSAGRKAKFLAETAESSIHYSPANRVSRKVSACPILHADVAETAHGLSVKRPLSPT
jgi:hypothetical protein